MKLSMPRFDQAAVLVVGDVMLDRYWHGGTSRISPEAPVPVVKVEQIEDRPGGAANVALNIAALGAPATLIGVTGEDEAAAREFDKRVKIAELMLKEADIKNKSKIVELQMSEKNNKMAGMEEDFLNQLTQQLSASQTGIVR